MLPRLRVSGQPRVLGSVYRFELKRLAYLMELLSVANSALTWLRSGDGDENSRSDTCGDQTVFNGEARVRSDVHARCWHKQRSRQCPVRLLSPKNWPGSRIPTTASLP